LLVIAVACVAAPISVIRSRRLVFEAWAKFASVLICAFGLIWAGLAFSLLRLGEAVYGPTGVLLTHARIFLGGLCLGLVLAVLIARPYKRMSREKLPTAV